MDSNTLLPYVLEALTRKPELSDTIDNLCTEIESQLLHEHNNKYGDIRNAVQRALKVGKGLGIIAIANDVARVPFSFRSRNNRVFHSSENFDSVEYRNTGLAGEAHHRFNTHAQNGASKNRVNVQKTAANAKNNGKGIASSKTKGRRKGKNAKQEVQPPDEIDNRQSEPIVRRRKTKRYGKVGRRIRKARNSGRKRRTYRRRK